MLGQEGERRRPLEGGDICPKGASQKEKHSREKEQQVKRPGGRDKLARLKNEKAGVVGGEWGQMRLGTGEACRPGTELEFFSDCSG